MCMFNFMFMVRKQLRCRYTQKHLSMHLNFMEVIQEALLLIEPFGG